MYESVAQESRAALLGNDKCGFRCRRVSFIHTSFCPAPLGDEDVRKCRSSAPCCTLGRRRCTKVLPKRAALHPRAMKKCESVAQESRAAPSGDEDVRKCRPREPCCTLGRRKSAKVSLKRAVLHSWATISVVFVAEGFPSSIRHSALRPWAMERREESPDCASRHLQVRDSQASSFPESSAPSPAPVVGGVQGAGRMVVRPLYRPLYPAYSFDIWKYLLFLS